MISQENSAKSARRELSEWSVNLTLRLSCKEEDRRKLCVCGECQSCLLNSRLLDSSQWFLRAGEASKRRFLTGILVRCQSVEILQRVQDVLQVTLGKDFTYARSRVKPSLLEDRGAWDSDRALDTKHLAKDMIEMWEWFSNSPSWTRSNYVLRILGLCETALLHALGNLVRVLIAQGKRNFLQFNAVPLGTEEAERSWSDSSCSIYFGDHPELDLPVQASSVHEPNSFLYETQDNRPIENLDHLKTEKRSWSELEVTQQSQKEKQDDSESDSDSSEDPALMVVPRSSKSMSGVSLHRDFIRGLPVDIAKRILGLLDTVSLQSCKQVSQHWQYLTGEILEELKVKKMLENKARILQGSCSGVNPVYAKIREVLVPFKEEDEDIQPSKTSPINTMDNRGFESVYMGTKTKAVEMEERNVYCGVFNVLVLLDREDPFRVIHYSGGQKVATGSKDRMVRLLDVTLLKEVPPLMQGHAGSVRAVLLCEERDLLISASYDLSIRCWNLKTGVCTKLFWGHTGSINCLDLHGDRLVSGAKDCKVKVWNLQTGQCYRRLRFRHRKAVVCVKIDTSLVLSGCEGGLVKVWDMESGTLLRVIKAHEGTVKCLFFDQWHILSGGSDGQVLAWSTSCDFKKFLMVFHHPREVLTLSLLFLRVITGCLDGKIRIFDFLSGECLRVIKVSTHQSPVLSLHTHHNNIFVNCSRRVVLLQFGETCWDYSARPTHKLHPSAEALPRTPSHPKLPYARVRAERMALVRSSNPKIYSRASTTDVPALSHHARSLSAVNMHRAQAVQRESMRPATWRELQAYQRSRAYIDLQPEFIKEPPSALSPGRPITRCSTGDKPWTRDTSRSNAVGSGKLSEKSFMSPSESAVRERVKKRGPHRPVTLDQMLLKVRSTQQPRSGDLASINMKLNAAVRDAWGPPPTDSPPSFPTAPKIPHSVPKSSTPSSSKDIAKIQTSPQTSPSRGQDFNLQHSRCSRQSHSSIYPRTLQQSGLKPKRPQSSGVVRKVGVLTTTAEEDVQTPRILVRIAVKHPVPPI